MAFRCRKPHGTVSNHASSSSGRSTTSHYHHHHHNNQHQQSVSATNITTTNVSSFSSPSHAVTTTVLIGASSPSPQTSSSTATSSGNILKPSNNQRPEKSAITSRVPRIPFHKRQPLDCLSTMFSSQATTARSPDALPITSPSSSLSANNSQRFVLWPVHSWYKKTHYLNSLPPLPRPPFLTKLYKPADLWDTWAVQPGDTIVHLSRHDNHHRHSTPFLDSIWVAFAIENGNIKNNRWCEAKQG